MRNNKPNSIAAVALALIGASNLGCEARREEGGGALPTAVAHASDEVTLSSAALTGPNCVAGPIRRITNPLPIGNVTYDLDNFEPRYVTEWSADAVWSARWDVTFVHNPEAPTIRTMLLQNVVGAPAEIAVLANRSFESVGACEIPEATFSTGRVYQPLDHYPVLLIRTATGAVFKLGNVREYNGSGVTFDVARLTAYPNEALTPVPWGGTQLLAGITVNSSPPGNRLTISGYYPPFQSGPPLRGVFYSFDDELFRTVNGIITLPGNVSPVRVRAYAENSYGVRSLTKTVTLPPTPGTHNLRPVVVGNLRRMPESAVADQFQTFLPPGELLGPTTAAIGAYYSKSTEQNRSFRRFVFKYAVPKFQDWAVTSASLICTRTTTASPQPLRIGWYTPGADYQLTNADYSAPMTTLGTFDTATTSERTFDVTSAVNGARGGGLAIRYELDLPDSYTAMASHSVDAMCRMVVTTSKSSPRDCTTKPDGTACDDGNLCTQQDRCSAGLCVGGPAVTCGDDGNACTIERCSPTLGCVRDRPLACDDKSCRINPAGNPAVTCDPLHPVYVDATGLGNGTFALSEPVSGFQAVLETAAVQRASLRAGVEYSFAAQSGQMTGRFTVAPDGTLQMTDTSRLRGNGTPGMQAMNDTTVPQPRIDWTMQERFGKGDVVRAWTSDNVLYPDEWNGHLDACGSSSPASPIVKYSWVVERITIEPFLSGGGLPKPMLGVGVETFLEPVPRWRKTITSGSCKVPFTFPTLGTYSASLTVTTQLGKIATIGRDIEFKDHLVISMGDSYASGEGVPNENVSSALINGRFTNQQIIDAQNYAHDPSGNNEPRAASPEEQARRKAAWLAWQTHAWDEPRRRLSRWAGPVQAALMLERSDPRTSVTFISVAQSGATVPSGILGPKPAHSNPTGFGDPVVEGQIDAVKALINKNGFFEKRSIDFLLLSIGGNDISFGPIVKSCAIPTEIATGDCVTGPNIQKVNDGISFLQGADGYARVRTRLMTELKVHKVLHTEYPNPTVETIYGDLCNEMRFHNAVYFIDGVIDANEIRWAHDFLLPRLNTTVNSTTATLQTADGRPFLWRAVSGIAGEYAGHAYCGWDNFITTFRESHHTVLDENGTMHPNKGGQEVIARALATAMDVTDPAYVTRPDIVSTAIQQIPAECPANQAAVGAMCSGASCNTVGLMCKPLPGNTTLGSSLWSAETSSENPGTFTTCNGGNPNVCTVDDGVTCGNQAVITGVRCIEGQDCSKLRFECAQLNTGRLRNCQWSEWFSDEERWNVFLPGRVANGARCRGTQCDVMSYSVCEVAPN